MKIAIITDQHLDGRKGSLAFWNYFQRFYNEIFFPTLEKHGITTILDLGDTFDNRKSMDYSTFARIKADYFDRLAGYDVHMILGNHCTYYKNTNKINSPELLLEQYNNITIYSDPVTLELGGKEFLMLPWINSGNRNEAIKAIEESNAPVCAGHLEIDGFEVMRGHKFNGGFSSEQFKKFDRVWSGHFHHKSKHGNIQYLGNPYQMFWNDYADTRGFHIYDTDTDRLTYIKNPFDMFAKIYYNDIERDYGEYDTAAHKDQYVKVVVEEKQKPNDFENLIDGLYHNGAHDVKIIETLVDTAIDDDVELNVKDTLTLLGEYIDEVDIQVDKSDLKTLMQSLYIEACEVS
ncbi:MAG: recombinase [Verrucomicrobiales bacterium]|nr:recombinase [Verrucomicrobiales bacterium]|tara:strand:- start:1156 stop:2196 length:1041 start_codon:yes stop_codon:yes gene_type:complete